MCAANTFATKQALFGKGRPPARRDIIDEIAVVGADVESRLFGQPGLVAGQPIDLAVLHLPGDVAGLYLQPADVRLAVLEERLGEGGEPAALKHGEAGQAGRGGQGRA